MDEFWKKVYDALMTPVPQPKGTELDKLFEYLRSVETPTIGELPTAPEWLKKYAEERRKALGLPPQDSGTTRSPLMGLRNMLINQDPYHPDTQMPNVYRGELQPDFESGNSLPEVYDRTRPLRI